MKRGVVALAVAVAALRGSLASLRPKAGNKCVILAAE